MAQTRLARFATTALALFVVLSTLTAPVAATQDDGGLLDGDDDDDGIISNTTDTVTDTVDSTTDTVSETTGVDTDASDATDTVDSTTDAVSGATGTTSTDAVSADSLAFSELPDAERLVGSGDDAGSASGSLVGEDGVVDARNLELNTDELPAGTAPVPAAEAPTDPLERRVGTDDLPVGPSDLPLDALPVTGEDAPVQPEDSPYGSEGQGNFNACRLPADEQDLPLDSVPTPGELGVPAPPGVPLDLLTPQAAAGLVLGIPPRPCEVYDPHDPSVDPTDPADNGEASTAVNEVDLSTDRVLYFGRSDAEYDQFRGGSTYIVAADDESVVVYDVTEVTDGRTRHYLFFSGQSEIRYRNATGDGEARVGVLGRHVGFSADCEESDLANASVNVENPQSSGPCSYSVEGLPSLPVGPGTIFDAIEEPPEPPALPGAPDVGDLPSNAESMLDL